jgi:hypothetical protein
MRKYILSILILTTSLLQSQTTTILDQSGFRHDYVLSELRFIEDSTDAFRLNYIATVAISDKQTRFLVVAGFMDLLKIKAKELGANTYFVSGYSETESSVQLIVKLFFAGQKFLDINEGKKLKNLTFVFNQTRFSSDTGIFFLNGKQINFESEKYYSFAIEKGIRYKIATNNSELTSVELYDKKQNKTHFFIIPASKRNLVLNRNKFDPLQAGILINGIPVTFGKNKPYKLNYDIGRLLLAAYK